MSPKGHVAVNWLCKCECGNLTIVRGCNLKSGASQSCGCERIIHQIGCVMDIKESAFMKYGKECGVDVITQIIKNYQLI